MPSVSLWIQNFYVLLVQNMSENRPSPCWGRLPVGVQVFSWTQADLLCPFQCFWGFLFSAPLVRMRSWDKYILCCPSTICLVNWVNTDSCFSIYKFCLLVSEWWWPNQSNTLSFTVWQTAWNCWHKQLVCFVLTLKEDAIWNLAYFKNTNSYLCLTDLITLRGPKFVILCKI